MSFPSLQDHTDAVIAALEGRGLLVGDGEAPKDDDGDPVPHGWQDTDPPTFVPYMILYPLDGDSDETDSLVDPYEDVALTWQATCVGESRRQTEWLVEHCNLALLTDGITVAGRSVEPFDPQLEAAGPRRDDEVDPPVFFATPRYRAVSRPT